MGVPPVIIHFNRIFHYKPSSYILGYHLWNPPIYVDPDNMMNWPEILPHLRNFHSQALAICRRYRKETNVNSWYLEDFPGSLMEFWMTSGIIGMMSIITQKKIIFWFVTGYWDGMWHWVYHIKDLHHLDRNLTIWRFPRIGVPTVIIHLWMGFSLTKTIQW